MSKEIISGTGGTLPTHNTVGQTQPASLPIHDGGHDPEHFNRSKAHEELRLGWLTRVKWMLKRLPQA